MLIGKNYLGLKNGLQIKNMIGSDTMNIKIMCMDCSRWIGNVGSVSLAKTKMLCSACIINNEKYLKNMR